MTRIAVLVLCLSVTSNALATELTKEQRDKAALIWYWRIEKDTKASFDSFVSEYKKNDVNATSAQGDQILQVMKTLFYNKAYITAACLGETMLDSSSPDAILTMQRSHQKCVEERLRDGLIFFSIAKSYGEMFVTTAARCEIQSRLFDRELMFPPYDFLKGPLSMLLDFDRFNKCFQQSPQ